MKGGQAQPVSVGPVAPGCHASPSQPATLQRTACLGCRHHADW